MIKSLHTCNSPLLLQRREWSRYQSFGIHAVKEFHGVMVCRRIDKHHYTLLYWNRDQKHSRVSFQTSFWNSSLLCSALLSRLSWGQMWYTGKRRMAGNLTSRIYTGCRSWSGWLMLIIFWRCTDICYHYVITVWMKFSTHVKWLSNCNFCYYKWAHYQSQGLGIYGWYRLFHKTGKCSLTSFLATVTASWSESDI